MNKVTNIKTAVTDWKKKTDKFYLLEPGSFNYTGPVDVVIKYIEEKQLLDVELWKLFVEQFRFDADDEDAGWRCEYWGKMMRGACFVYQYTQNEVLYSVLKDSILDLLSAAKESGKISTYSDAAEFDGWDMWGRKYVLLGLQYFLEICKEDFLSEKIVSAMCAHADYIIDHVGKKQEGKKEIADTTSLWEGKRIYDGLNSSSILEPIVRLYILTEEKKYLDFATYIIENTGGEGANVFELAYEDELYPYQYPSNPFPKAYEMMSCFEGLIEYYRVTGIEKWKTAFTNFVHRVAESEVTIVGGLGATHEFFDHASIRQARTNYDGCMQETCVTVTWLKLCMQMLGLSGEAGIADQMEKSYYNAMLGAVNTEGCTTNEGFPFDSYSPLVYGQRGRQVGGYKQMKGGKAYGCCACIGSAGLAVGVMSSVMKTEDGLVFNQYFPGTIKTKTLYNKSLRIDIHTTYPVEGTVKLSLHMDVKEKMKILFRIPKWSQRTIFVLNGATLQVDPGEYIELERMWEDGDTIDIEFDMRTKLLYAPECEEDINAKNHIALKRGPIVLARDERFKEDIEKPVAVLNTEEGVKISFSNDAKFQTWVELKAMQENWEEIHLIDYSSAGKDWNSYMATWLPCEK